MFRIILASTAFYARAVVQIGYAAFKARRGRLDNAGLVNGSHALRRSLEAVGVRFEVTGAEALDRQGGPYVFVANHVSALETQILPSILQHAAPCTFVVKSSLVNYPVFGKVLRAFHPIVVERADARADLRQVLEEGSSRLRDGISVIIFPQAHRTAMFDRKAFNSIGMRLAKAAGVPMVPIALDTGAWAQGRLVTDIGWIRPDRPVRFAIGSPIQVSAGGQAAHQEAVQFIESTLTSWQMATAGDAGSSAAKTDEPRQDQVPIGIDTGSVTRPR